ncbi:MAG: DNA polymerase III subunit gamma/tau [Alphaproteobacteria bacterium]|nr:DNA polymerase III subunit gamma/tau [Alphaproteobacteria bacterium]
MTASTSPTPYRVLARKYRPTDFSALIGQEAMVRTLTNAIRSGRLAHAFVLTGVRGVGKTTTARIIARALNCVEGPTIDPCGVCEHCRSIAEDRHVDVLEMDAASRTGVGDMRELIEGVRYRPTSARFKIYIIDEVHMLSNAAFNALLKTLEEPPEHVKFVFATTELRKIPVTVLSRCQRFDLRRVDIEDLAAHFARIAEKEGATVEDAALKLIARAADGSVRDGLSLLDQAIAHCGGAVGEAEMRDMLGLADRARVFDLADALFKGDAAAALAQMGDQYAAGADPVVVLEDLLELVHWLTRLKVAPGQKESLTIGETERVRGGDMAQRLGMGALTRAWQILLKGLGEARGAPSPLQAAEMALIRLTYAADLPSPAEVIEALRSQPPSGGGGGGGGGGAPARGTFSTAVSAVSAPAPAPAGAPQAALAAQEADPLPMPVGLEQVAQLFSERREAVLASHLRSDVHLVHFEPGRIEFRPGASAPADLAQRMGRLLSEWTGRRWIISLAREGGAPSLREQAQATEARRRHDAGEHPLVQAVLAAFPGAVIEAVRDTNAETPAADEPAGDETPLGEDDS